MSNTIKIGAIGMGEGTLYASEFAEKLEAADQSKPLILDFHSEGGSVFEGFEIANLISDYAGKTVARVRSAAFSIASYCAIACDEVEIAANGFFMVHNPYSETSGDDEAHAKNAKLLGELKTKMVEAYANRTGKSSEEVTAIMKAETYIGAEDSIEMGLADRVINAPKSVKPLSQKHLPVAVLAAMYGSDQGKQTAATPKETEVSNPNVATAKWLKTNFPKASVEFKFRCMEEEMTEEEVAKAHTVAMEEENEELKAKVSAMEEELTALKAKAMEEETAKAMEEEEEAVALAKSKGIKPVATSVKPVNTAPADQQFNALIEKFVAQGKPRIKAVLMANRERPDLRKAMVEAAN